MTELVRSLRARKIEVLVVGLGSLDLASVAIENNVLYARWKLPPGKVSRARRRALQRARLRHRGRTHAAFARDADRPCRAPVTYPQATTARSDEAGLSRYPGLGISFDAAIAAHG